MHCTRESSQLLGGFARILVTGAGQGNGRAIAVGLGALGAEAVLADSRAGPVHALSAQNCADGGRAHTWEMDVADPASGAKVATMVADQVGPIDGLVNNAAILRQARIDEDGFEAAWDDVLRVNLDGTMRPIRPFLPQLRRSGRNRQHGFGCGVVLAGNLSGYSAAKAGVLALTRSQSTTRSGNRRFFGIRHMFVAKEAQGGAKL